jgi:hypothetical protein
VLEGLVLPQEGDEVSRRRGSSLLLNPRPDEVDFELVVLCVGVCRVEGERFGAGGERLGVERREEGVERVEGEGVN